jgi:putative ABC transport system permease protein
MITWNIRPIASALLRNRTGATLVALQIAIGLAVLVNAVYVVQQRVEKISRPTGMDIDNVFVVGSAGFAKDFDYLGTMTEDLAYLRSLPGVVAASPANAIPLSGGGSSNGITNVPNKPDPESANYFEMDEQSVAALGVTLAAGRPFDASEILPPTQSSEWVPEVILSKPLANALFPDGNALGKTVYDGLNSPATVVGIIENMHGSWPGWDKVDHTMLVPRLPSGPNVVYMVRAKPGQRDALMRTVEEHMGSSNPGRLLRWVRTLNYFKDNSYLDDRNMAIFLVTVTAALLAITALGIFGLATFNVSTRIRQIGTRRAVGARRMDIVRHFLVENWMVTSAGVVVGAGLALAIGYWLSVKYELPRLNLYYLVGGFVAVWILGLLAAWQPARRASAISPAVATRTV